MKRTVPLLITAIAGLVLIVSFFVPEIQELGEKAAIWFDILAAIAFILGGGNLLKLHLKTMSDGKPGWGYSAVTIVAFLATLLFGLLKLGSPPADNSEYYGETFAPLPLAAMPEYRVQGSLPDRADGEPLPASVRRQLREENGELIFQGWMTKDQKGDLSKYKETLDWRYLVEQLFDASQHEEIKDKVKYRSAHEALAVAGVLTDELRAELETILGDSPAVDSALEQLAQQSREETSVPAEPPSTFSIPDKEKSRIRVGENLLTIVGPMSTETRDSLAVKWAGFKPAMPLSEAQRDALKKQIEDLGNPLTTDEDTPEGEQSQSEIFDKFFLADLGADAMIAAVNTAGIVAPEEKTAGELIEERDSGVKDLNPLKEAPEPVELNDEQKEAIRNFFDQQSQTVEELQEELASLGELTDAQKEAVEEAQKKAVEDFVASLPREAERRKNLGVALLKAGPLTSEQKEFLFAPAVEMDAWRETVGRLFVKAHQVKFPWSGDYSAQGNPFWFTYEYVFQPLLTTTFAMLAFYVASAAFRAFRAKNIEASLLLGTAFIILLGRTFAGVLLTDWIPDQFSALKIDQMTIYIMKIFNTAGNRAIMIGIALGIASTSLKVLLGIDRSYLGSGDD